MMSDWLPMCIYVAQKIIAIVVFLNRG